MPIWIRKDTDDTSSRTVRWQKSTNPIYNLSCPSNTHRAIKELYKGTIFHKYQLVTTVQPIAPHNYPN